MCKYEVTTKLKEKNGCNDLSNWSYLNHSKWALKNFMKGIPLKALHSPPLDCLFDMWNSIWRYDQVNSIDHISETDISRETIFLFNVFLAASFHQTTCSNRFKHYSTVIEIGTRLWNMSVTSDISHWKLSAL